MRTTLLACALGLSCVLHTWSRTLAYHPHVHCIVTGGGLALDQERWIASGPRYLFPLPVMAALFRGKMLCGLRRAKRRGELRLPASIAAPTWFDALIDRLFATDWIVYAKPPFGGPEHVYTYLGPYTHRVGLDNRRIRAIDDDHVHFIGRHRKLVTLTHDAFIGRFLQHVLPPDFVKLRHYGLLAASHATTLLEIARDRLGDHRPHRQLHPTSRRLGRTDRAPRFLMTDIARHTRTLEPLERAASRRARWSPCVRATTLRSNATAIAIDDHACATWAAPHTNETAARCRSYCSPHALAMLVATVPEPRSPYGPRLRRAPE